MITIIALVLTLLLSAGLSAQDINLPAPRQNGGKPLMEALAQRKTIRSYTTEVPSLQVVSNLLWAASGVNREDGRRTAPTARNMQQIDIYLFSQEGVYLYLPGKHTLKQVKKGDYRSTAVRQKFAAEAPYILVYVANYDKMEGMDQKSMDFYGATDTGFISQNVYLYCASEGLGTVVLGMIYRDALKELLGFNGYATLGQPFGFPK